MVGKVGGRARWNCGGMNGKTNKNALVGECVKNMKGSWRSARDLPPTLIFTATTQSVTDAVGKNTFLRVT